MKRQSGFTLIELVLVVAILGVLAMAALPRLFSVSLGSAQNAAKAAVVGAVQTGVSLYSAQQVAAGALPSAWYPASLGGAVGQASNATPLFANVLSTPVTAAQWWRKIGTAGVSECYLYDLDNDGTKDAGEDTYKYDIVSGTFLYNDACL